MVLDFYVITSEMGKLALAAIFGGIIGFEREYHGQAAGFRTNILVCLGACLMMMLSLRMEALFQALDSNTVVRLDPGRIASYAIASMGFLGAGAIIKGKGSVRGLTTAASLWLVTGIGLSVGAGYIFPPFVVTVISLLILYNIRQLKPSFPHHLYTLLTLKCHSKTSLISDIRRVLHDYPGLEIKFVNFSRHVATESVVYRLRLYSKEHLPWGKVAGRLMRLPGVEEIAWEEGNVP